MDTIGTNLYKQRYTTTSQSKDVSLKSDVNYIIPLLLCSCATSNHSDLSIHTTLKPNNMFDKDITEKPSYTKMKTIKDNSYSTIPYLLTHTTLSMKLTNKMPITTDKTRYNNGYYQDNPSSTNAPSHTTNKQSTVWRDAYETSTGYYHNTDNTPFSKLFSLSVCIIKTINIYTHNYLDQFKNI